MHKIRWTEEEKKSVADHYRSVGTRDLQKLLAGRSEKAIFHMAERIGLKKSHERLRELGRENIRLRWDKRCEPPSPPC